MSLASRGLRSAAELAAQKPHGTRIRYMGGCKCLHCRMANSNYETARAAARRAGFTNKVVDAAPARKHIFALSRAGVGRNMVALCAGVAKTVVCEIRSGKKLRAREETIRKILAVTKDCKGEKALIPAARAWHMLNQLLGEGFSRAELARRMGYKSPALQINKKRITARSEQRIKRLYSQVMV